MMFSSYYESMTKIEIGMLLLFVVYLVMDIYPPDILASYIDTSIGMVGILLITLYVFMNYNPILGVVFLFVAYEIVRRSARVNNRVPMILHTPSQAKKDAELAEMNPSPPTSLEEEVVDKMAPVGKSSLISYTMSEYKPVSSDIHNASVL
jgi:hypothetical protein